MKPYVERRETMTLNALWRNHPSYAGWHSMRPADDVLIDWAAEQSDDDLLAMRNLGQVGLAWLRSQQQAERVREMDVDRRILYYAGPR